jgi:hypothetical protein
MLAEKSRDSKLSEFSGLGIFRSERQQENIFCTLASILFGPAANIKK